MANIIVEAVISTVGPLSIKMPVAEGMRENEYENFPLMVRGVDEVGQPKLTGYLPASTVRGFFRRSAGLAAMRARGEGGTTVAQAYSDILGQGADDKADVDLQTLAAMREGDAILDLFGSWSVRSRLLVSNFVPDMNLLPTVFTGVRKDLEDTEGVLDLMAESEREAYFSRSDTNSDRAAADAVAKKLKREINKAKKAGQQTADLETALADAEMKLAGLKSQMGEMANSSRTITQYFALSAGVELHGKIIIERAKERDLPMLLAALDDLSQRPLFGAQVARGCGEISGKFSIKVDGVVKKIVTVGGWESARVADF